jgi:hypothetical protein
MWRQDLAIPPAGILAAGADAATVLRWTELTVGVLNPP